MKHVIKNHIFLWKICAKASPKYMTFLIYDAVRFQVLVFLEHVVLIRYVLHCAEYHEPFYKAAIAIGFIFLLYVIGFGIDGKCNHGMCLVEKPKIYKALKEQLYQKAAVIDLACYDNPDYYNDFVLAVSESDATIDRFFAIISSGIKSVIIFLTTGVFYLTVDPVGILFIFASFLFTVLIAKTINKLNFSLKKDVNPIERKRNYVNRLFYLADYAKELRLHPEVGDMLETELTKANEQIREYTDPVSRKRTRLAFIQRYCLSEFITDGLYVAYLIYKAAVLHTIDYSNAVVLFNRTGELRRAMKEFTEIFPGLNENNMYIEKIRSFLEYEPVIMNETGREPEKEPKELVLDHVSFRYETNDENTLTDISLRVKPGEKIAIVGYNGAGKTTLVKLLMRLYDPTKGSILYDGENIRDYQLKQYREQIGVVFQDYQIYGATLLENVILNEVDETKKQMIREEAAKALLHSGFEERLQSLPNGLDTSLTTEFDKKGVNFSGGESQKVAIARSFYKDVNILIMDEPSSALDPIAEYSLNKAMRDMAENKTVFYISHRLSTTRDADRILMLENGRIIEEGTHESLLALQGKYAEMWNVQAGKYAI